MWGNQELIRLALEAVCIVVASLAGALVARRTSIALATATGAAAGIAAWLVLFAVQLRWFANWS